MNFDSGLLPNRSQASSSVTEDEIYVLLADQMGGEMDVRRRIIFPFKVLLLSLLQFMAGCISFRKSCIGAASLPLLPGDLSRSGFH